MFMYERGEVIFEHIAVGLDNDAGTKITNFLKRWYSNTADSDINARNHKQVINSFKRVRDQQVACGQT